MDVRKYRFIPTCVGNTFGQSHLLRQPPVHPHVRGEYRQWWEYEGRPYGSSPRAWGIPVLC